MTYLITILIAVAVIFAIAIFFIERKLKDGERQISAGQQKLSKYDNWFVRIFCNTKLSNGRQEISDDKKKLTFGKCLCALCVLICVVCIVSAIILMFISKK